jgi:signal transduction histidine kinase
LDLRSGTTANLTPALRGVVHRESEPWAIDVLIKYHLASSPRRMRRRAPARIVRAVSKIELLEAAARRIDPRAVDTAGAALLGVVAAVSVISHPRPYVAVPAALVLAATVALRRLAPVVAVLVALVAAGVFSSTGGGALAVGPVMLVLDYYALGRRPGGRRSRWIDAILLVVPVVGVAGDPNTSSPGGTLVVDLLFVWSLFFALPYGAGRAVRSRTELNAELRVNTERLEIQQRERARQAVVEERTRIARELHDVVAHSMSVMVIQTAAARAVARRDPAAAAEALRSVESCGRDALVDLRRMVGVLHRSDIDLLSGTAPGLSQLGTLADRARASGLPVHVTVEGEARSLPPALDLVSFRIVQEALTNATKHAGPARAFVRVTFTADWLQLEIVDTGRGPVRRRAPGDAVGHGLVGMRERLSLYGGELRTGRRSGGGYQVLARIPMAEVATP